MTDQPAVFSMGTMQEEMDKMPKWVPLKENLYELEVVDVERTFEVTPYSKGEKEEQVKLSCKAKRCLDGSPVLNIDGEVPTSDLVNVWLNPNAVGYNKKTKEAHKTRKILTALMGVPEDAELELKSWDDLASKSMRAYVGIGTREDGEKKNVVDKFAVLNAPEKEVAPKEEAAAEEPKAEEEVKKN